MKIKAGLSTFALKIIAVTAMIVDHIGKTFFPQYVIFEMIGRIAFPIFAYLLTEGFLYTHDIKKYMIRMGIFALVSEVPFDLVFSGAPLEFGTQNVFFTLFLGLIMLYFFRKLPIGTDRFLCVVIFVLAGELLRVDYGGIGLLMIFWFYQYRERKTLLAVGIAMINILLVGPIQIWAVFALVPILLHNGHEGPKMKWLFYGIYPIHLLVIYLVKIFL